MKVCKATVVFLLFLCVGCAQQQAAQPAHGAGLIELTAVTQAKAEQWFVRGHTRQAQVLNRLGQPHGVSQVGNLSYWHYAQVKHSETEQKSNFVRLTLAFDGQGVLVDFDLQYNQFQQNN